MGVSFQTNPNGVSYLVELRSSDLALGPWPHSQDSFTRYGAILARSTAYLAPKLEFQPCSGGFCGVRGIAKRRDSVRPQAICGTCGSWRANTMSTPRQQVHLLARRARTAGQLE